MNGPADPFVGRRGPDARADRSAPLFRVQKISTDLTGDPTQLLAGDTLRYTVTVKNIGTANATTDAPDAVPATRRYVAGSTTLNGVAVPDGPSAAPHSSPASRSTRPRIRRRARCARTRRRRRARRDDRLRRRRERGPRTGPSRIRASSARRAAASSTGPRTIPTRWLRTIRRSTSSATRRCFAPKSVTLSVDGGALGIVDPGDGSTTRSPITTAAPSGDGRRAEGGAREHDLRRGLHEAERRSGRVCRVGAPDQLQRSTPPLPGPARHVETGQRARSSSSTSQVNAGVPAGTIISNQARVDTVELPDPLPTATATPRRAPSRPVVVGDVQALSITKTVIVVGGGAALAGSGSSTPSRSQHLDRAGARSRDQGRPERGDAGSAHLRRGNGHLNGTRRRHGRGTDHGRLLGALRTARAERARPCCASAPRSMGATFGTLVTNTGMVTWNMTETASASVSVTVGGTPGVGLLSGNVWHDAASTMRAAANAARGLDRRAPTQRRARSRRR